MLFETDDKRQKTVASKFRRRLKKLLEDVSRTETRYVRCVKPNGEASSSLFDAHRSARSLDARASSRRSK